MATSSIFSTIRVIDEKSAQRLVNAMIAAEEVKTNKESKPVAAQELKGKDLQNFFKEY
ncbi:MAG: hypothetical protein LBJ48_00740 [Coriobacteriales bacterium]|jgi:hypothetical protein|nr:hypothetical protein [Coriobacteriales bacterium]